MQLQSLLLREPRDESRVQILIKCRRANTVHIRGLFLFRGRDRLATASKAAGCLEKAMLAICSGERAWNASMLLPLLLAGVVSRLSTGSNNWPLYRWMDCLAARLYLLVTARGQRAGAAFSCERLFKDIAQILETWDELQRLQ